MSLNQDILFQISKYLDRELYSKVLSFDPFNIGYFKKEKINIITKGYKNNLFDSYGGFKLISEYLTDYINQIESNLLLHFQFIGSLIQITDKKFIYDDFLLKIIMTSPSGNNFYIIQGKFDINLNYTPIPKLNSVLSISFYKLDNDHLNNVFGSLYNLSDFKKGYIVEKNQSKLFDLINDVNLIKNMYSAKKFLCKFVDFLFFDSLLMNYEPDNNTVNIVYNLNNNYNIKHLSDKKDNFLFEVFTFRPENLNDFLNFDFDRDFIRYLFIHKDNISYYYYMSNSDYHINDGNIITEYEINNIKYENPLHLGFYIENINNSFIKYDRQYKINEICSKFEYQNLAFFCTKVVNNEQYVPESTFIILKNIFPDIMNDFFYDCSSIDIKISYNKNNYIFNMRNFSYNIYPYIHIYIDFIRNEFEISSSLSDEFNSIKQIDKLKDYDLKKILYDIFLSF